MDINPDTGDSSTMYAHGPSINTTTTPPSSRASATLSIQALPIPLAPALPPPDRESSPTSSSLVVASSTQARPITPALCAKSSLTLAAETPNPILVTSFRIS